MTGRKTTGSQTGVGRRAESPREGGDIQGGGAGTPAPCGGELPAQAGRRARPKDAQNRVGCVKAVQNVARCTGVSPCRLMARMCSGLA